MKLTQSPSGPILESRNVVRDSAAAFGNADTAILAATPTVLQTVNLQGANLTQQVWAEGSLGLKDTSGVANPCHVDLLVAGVVVASQPVDLAANGSGNVTVRGQVAVGVVGATAVELRVTTTGAATTGATSNSSSSLQAALVDPT